VTMACCVMSMHRTREERAHIVQTTRERDGNTDCAEKRSAKPVEEPLPKLDWM
jgi:hypothetical protein